MVTLSMLSILSTACVGRDEPLSRGDEEGAPVEKLTEQLVFTEKGGDHASGQFERGGLRIRFTVRPDRVGVYRADGFVLFESAQTDAGRVVVAMGETRSSASQKVRTLSQTGTSNPSRSSNGAAEELQRFLKYPEARLLPYLSRQLGEQGYTGASAPSSLLLHLLAMAVADAGGIRDVGAPLQEENSLQPDWTCEDGKYPVNAFNDPCFGTCGPYCTHWYWVCGETSGKPCARGGCVWHDYIGFYANQTNNPSASDDFWNAYATFEAGGGCSNKETCAPLSDESFPCRYWDGDITECDKHGSADPNPANDTQDCAYYLGSNTCRERGTPNAQAGMSWEYDPANSETWACSTWDGNIAECDRHGFADPNKANDTQDCAYYLGSNKCLPRGTANCQAGIYGSIPW
ncbi:hypothetical protein ACLEPN_02775 [Myxococcus sp. 1LA]